MQPLAEADGEPAIGYLLTLAWLTLQFLFPGELERGRLANLRTYLGNFDKRICDVELCLVRPAS